MSFRPCDTLLAIKVINLAPGLRPSDRQVGVLLIEHFNRKSGRCDPGIERLAELLGCCPRTVMRATARLEKLGLFRKVRHGGYSKRNSYEPNWARIAQQEAAWKIKLHAKSRSRRSGMSPEPGQASHLRNDAAVTQTSLDNLPKQTFSGQPSKERGQSGRIASRPQSSADAARVQAERRWSDDLLRRYAALPVTYAEIVEGIDADLAAAATDAEVAKRGAGLLVIQRQLKLPVE